MRQSDADDFVREDILSQIKETPERRAEELCLGVVGEDRYRGWREQSYDTPSIEDHVDLCLEEVCPMDLASCVGIDYRAQEYADWKASLELEVPQSFNDWKVKREGPHVEDQRSGEAPGQHSKSRKDSE